jgi:hypothetical protein|tara:strand:- start:4600 stop:5226 length:627 start_codon:yes stop_codon:yes gene_type:complete
MTYPEIIREIGKRANDPELTKSRAIAGNLFVESLINVMLNEDTDIGQIGDYYQAIPFILSKDSWVNYTQTYELPNNTLKILDVSISSNDYAHHVSSPISIKRVSRLDVERMFLEDSFSPSGTEMFYYYKRLSSSSKQGLEFIISNEYYISGMLDNVPINVEVYISPKISDFTSTNKDLLGEYNLGTKIIYDSIALASSAIMSLTEGSK